MEKIVFLKDTDTVYSASAVTKSDNVCSIYFNGTVPGAKVLTSGFYIINENNGDNMTGDTFYGFKTVYRDMSPVMQLSNDGSHYIPPKPETKDITASVVWNDNEDEDRIRPTSLEVSLTQDGKVVAKGIVSKSNDWIYDFGEYVVTSEYSLSAHSVDGYEAVIDGLNITETHESLSQVKNAKLEELDSSCNTAMQASVPVELSTGTELFAFTELVQRDLANAYSSATALLQIGHPEIEIPFYNVNGVCALYLPNDIMAIYMTLGSYKTSNLTLLHQLENQVANMTTADEIRNVYFSVDCLDSTHKSSYDIQMAAAAKVIKTITDVVGEE